MLSLSSANAGSRPTRGKSLVAPPAPPPSADAAVGVVWDARRLVRDGGRRGVVGREGIVPDRVREWEREVVVVVGCWEGVVVVAMIITVCGFFLNYKVVDYSCSHSSIVMIERRAMHPHACVAYITQASGTRSPAKLNCGVTE